MPSGPKKRKKAAAAAAAAAAASASAPTTTSTNKEAEQQIGIHHPPSPTTPLPPQQEQELEAKADMESSDVSATASEDKDVNIEIAGSKAQEASSGEVLDAARLAGEGFEETAGSAQVEDQVGGGNLGEETSAEIVLQKPSEEEAEQVGEAGEVPISVPADFVASEEEEEESREIPQMGTIVDISTVSPISTEANAATGAAPIVERRTSLWNCCGLLDVFKSSQR